METITEESKKNQTVEQFLTDSMKNSRISGEVFLEQLEKETGLERPEVVKQLRSFKSDGKYLVGRKGHKSRFIWGEKLKEAIKPIAQSPKRIQQPKPNGTGSGYSLQVQIGESETHIIPIKLELVH